MKCWILPTSIVEHDDSLHVTMELTVVLALLLVSQSSHLYSSTLPLAGTLAIMCFVTDGLIKPRLVLSLNHDVRVELAAD